VKDAFKPELPTGMLGFVFNLRRPIFQNEGVREALSMAFDFEWANRNLFDGAYTHTQSFWQNSKLSSLGRAADEKELSILGSAKDRISPDILAGKPTMMVSDGSGSDRKILKAVVDTLKKAGYGIKNGKMTDASGTPLAFEIMTQNQDQEKVAIAYQRTLKMIGVEVSIRTVDDAQYQSRSGSFDYDVIMKSYPSSLSPGIEQVGRWGSDSKDRPGSFNFAGLGDADVDRVIQAMLNARSTEDFTAAVRAYDRLLLAGHYLVPLYHIGEQWVARWKHIEHPSATPLYGYQLPTWWDARAQK
jgi:peptide/nickel transport system substrate-binding protein